MNQQASDRRRLTIFHFSFFKRVPRQTMPLKTAPSKSTTEPPQQDDGPASRQTTHQILSRGDQESQAWRVRAAANRRSLFKRLLDYAITVPLCIVCFPIALIVMVMIKIVDPGPALFIQQREGRDGRSFPFFKFRSMYIDANERLEKHLAENPDRKAEWEEIFKLDNDPRVLPVIGNLLRLTSLDELPNLWNILRGDMSLVGPRPFPTYHLDEFDDEFRVKRASVWPGLTGHWQIERGDLTAQQHWDEKYINEWSHVEDVKLILRTIPTVLLARKPHF